MKKIFAEMIFVLMIMVLIVASMVFSDFVVRTVFGQTLEQRTKIAVIDTGINSIEAIKPYLCSFGHKDYTGTGLQDSNGHGTNIAGIIAKKMDRTKECLIIYKYVDFDAKKPYDDTQLNFRMALNDALKADVQYLNYSGGGAGQDSIEKNYIQKMLDKGVVVSVAAGNDHKDLSRDCYYYPACYGFENKNYHVVDNGNGFYRSPSSNWGGPVTNRENGENVEGAGVVLTGTSQATAILTGKLIEANRK